MATKGQPGFRHAVDVTRQLERAGMIGGGSLADTIEASGSTAAQTGRTHDRTPNPPDVTQKILAKQEPSTHDILADDFVLDVLDKNTLRLDAPEFRLFPRWFEFLALAQIGGEIYELAVFGPPAAI